MDKISIHAPHARSDVEPESTRDYIKFQSTLLMRGATSALHRLHTLEHISIHAPHARSDSTSEFVTSLHAISIHAPHARSDLKNPTLAVRRSNFNPRSSCEERHYSDAQHAAFYQFQSTLLMRGATAEKYGVSINTVFQSTLLMRGATLLAAVY